MKPLRTVLHGERRNEFLRERFTTRDYLTPQGRIVTVKTIMQIEFASKLSLTVRAVKHHASD